MLLWNVSGAPGFLPRLESNVDGPAGVRAMLPYRPISAARAITPTVSVIIPARNEADNLPHVFSALPPWLERLGDVRERRPAGPAAPMPAPSAPPTSGTVRRPLSASSVPGVPGQWMIFGLSAGLSGRGWPGGLFIALSPKCLTCDNGCDKPSMNKPPDNAGGAVAVDAPPIGEGTHDI